MYKYLNLGKNKITIIIRLEEGKMLDGNDKVKHLIVYHLGTP